jgi:hypothetical protein
MIRNIPLNKFVASPRNVRRTSDPAADLELKAGIEARGLLQNPVVSALTKPRGAFAVEAGERRRRALQSLADEEYSKARDELSQACERFSSGNFIAEVEVKGAALASLPPAMRFGGIAALAEEEAPDEAAGEPSHDLADGQSPPAEIEEAA